MQKVFDGKGDKSLNQYQNHPYDGVESFTP